LNLARGSSNLHALSLVLAYQAIEKLYKIIEADQPFDPSQVFLRQESFKQAIEEKTFVLSKVLYDKCTAPQY